ncbi:MAG: lysophospholipid acyltransferase family protein [Gemmatimonadota bacterium]|nr:lysophospholipid acyltransferase family protein [Gemmatimonadota bacterium]
MLYPALRAAADVALHWYYADIVVQGRERIPAHGPLIITANHPNALVDALVVGTTMRRRVLLTAKATLFENPALATVLRTVGVVPLRRAKDERDAAATISASRNSDAFRMVTRALGRQGAVLVFPEGISHDEPSLAPLRTGAARMALTAAADGVRGVRILPFGMVFEEKERPRSRVLVRIDEPINVDEWLAATRAPDAIRLTADIDSAMRRVTLNFASEVRARRAIALARALASIVEEPSSIGQTRPLATETELAHRIDVATDALASASPETVRQADVLITRVESLEARLAERHVALTDVHVSPRMRHGARFVLREGVLAVVTLPFAVLGRITHWIPLRLARMLALRTTAKDPSRDQPAMRTIVLGLAFVLLWYALQGVFLTRWFGIVAALLWLTVIFLAARVDFVLRDRLRRGWKRARSYLALRADPAFRENALQEIQLLVTEALALEQRLVPPSFPAGR